MEITRIVRVVDTREYTEEGDRWVPVPGSGTENECARCGRLHEVHATVELADGSRAVVGTGCMRGESLDLQSGIKRLTSASKRVARLESERRYLHTLIAEKADIESRVEALPLPAMSEKEIDHIDNRGYAYKTYEIHFADGCRPLVSLRALADDDRKRASSHWRENKAREYGLTYGHDYARYRLSGVVRDIERIEDKFPELREEPR